MASRMGLASTNRIASRMKSFNAPSAVAFIRIFQPSSDVARCLVPPLVVAPFQQAFVFLARQSPSERRIAAESERGLRQFPSFGYGKFRGLHLYGFGRAALQPEVAAASGQVRALVERDLPLFADGVE